MKRGRWTLPRMVWPALLLAALCRWTGAAPDPVPEEPASQGPTSEGPAPESPAPQGLPSQGLAPEGSAAVPQDAGEHLRRILERPLYRRWELRQERAGGDPEDAGWLENGLAGRIYKTLGEWLRWIFERRSVTSSGGGGSSVTLADSLRWAGWLALAAIAGYMLYVLLQSRRSGKKTGAASPVLGRRQIDAALETGDALALDGAEWMTEAERLSRQGDFRAGYRALYLALLSGLHAAGRIDYRRNFTNWMYVRGYRGGEPEKEGFSRLTGLFDRIWYGDKPAEGNALDELKLEVAGLLGKRGGQ